MKSKKIPMNINVYLPEEHKKILEKIAEKEERSVARQVSFIVKKYLEDNIEKED